MLFCRGWEDVGEGGRRMLVYYTILPYIISAFFSQTAQQLRWPTSSVAVWPYSVWMGGDWEGGTCRLVLLPAIWSNTVAEPNIPSKGGKVWVKISNKWRGEIVLGGKDMNKWIMQKKKSRYVLAPPERLRATKRYCLFTRLYQRPEGVNLCLPRPLLLWESDKVKWKSTSFSGIVLGDILVTWPDNELNWF